MNHEIGLGLQSNKTASAYQHLAQRAEAHGFDVLTVYHDLRYQPAFYPLLVMSMATRRVRLGAACYNPYTMAPYAIAGQLAALDDASNGRAYLGLARGTWLGAIGMEQPRPLTTIREAAAVIRHLLRKDAAAFEGEVFQVAANTTLRYPVARSDHRLLIGTWGRQTAALAGEIADEIKIGGSANPAMVNVMADYAKAGSLRAQRDQTEIVMGAVTVVDTDSRAARAKARTEVAMYLAVVAGLDPTVEVPDDLLSRVRALVDQGQHVAAGELIPDDVLDLFAFSGDPEQVAAQAAALFEAGASRVEFGTPHGLTDQAGIEHLGARVLPALRS